MWEEEEIRPTSSKKLFLITGVGLILLLVAGVIFLFPGGFGGQPTLSFSKREPSIIASKMYVNGGNLLGVTGDNLGFWRIWERDGIASVSRFGLTGEAEWVGEYASGAVVFDVNGRLVILADQQTGQVNIIEEGKGLVRSIIVDGKPQTVAVAQTGQFVVAYIPSASDAGTSSLQPKLNFYNRDGSLLFSTSYDNTMPLFAKLNQNGTQVYLMLSRVGSQGLENHLISYADNGQLLWTAELPAGPPVGMAVKPFGDRIAVAIDKSVNLFSGTGQLMWQHSSQGTVQNMVFFGPTDQVVYTSQKLSVLSFRKQATFTALGKDGVPAWQYQVNGSVPKLAGGSNALSVILANEEAIHNVGTDGSVRWTHRLKWDDKDKNTGVAYAAYSSDGSSVFVQLSDGRMFVLRGE